MTVLDHNESLALLIWTCIGFRVLRVPTITGISCKILLCLSDEPARSVRESVDAAPPGPRRRGFNWFQYSRVMCPSTATQTNRGKRNHETAARCRHDNHTSLISRNCSILLSCQVVYACGASEEVCIVGSQ